MPRLTTHPCRGPGCPVLLRGRGGYCSDHKRVSHARRSERRPTASQRGYDKDWRARRIEFLNEHPSCQRPRCGADSTVVDHVIPLSMGGPDDESNYQALCKPCHDGWKQRKDRSEMRRRRGL